MSNQKKNPWDMPAQAPPWTQDNNRIDVNLIAMLLWQSLLVGSAVAVSHMGWYLPNAGSSEMGLQYGLICFGFLCTAMVLLHVGGIRDHLSMRAEFSAEARYEKWVRNQMRLQQRRMQKENFFQQQQQQQQQSSNGNPLSQTFGYIPLQGDSSNGGETVKPDASNPNPQPANENGQ